MEKKPHKISKIWRQQIFLSFLPTIEKKGKRKMKSELLFGDFSVCLWNRNGCKCLKHRDPTSVSSLGWFFCKHLKGRKFLPLKDFSVENIKFDSNKLMGKTARVYFSTQTFYEMKSFFSFSFFQAIKFRAPVNVWEITLGWGGNIRKIH